MPEWLPRSPRWVAPPGAGPNPSWLRFAESGEEIDPRALFAIRGRWRDAGREWCAARGLIHQAAMRGRAVQGPLLAMWSAGSGVFALRDNSTEPR